MSLSLFSQENNQIDLRKIAEQNAEEIAKSLPNKINEIPADDFSLDNDDGINLAFDGASETDSDVGSESQIIEEDIIFGLDFFTTTPTSITSTSDLPVPNDYRVSLNDELRIIFSGNKQDIFNLPVNLDGTVFLPEIGAVQVSNISIKDVQQIIENLVNLSYVGVDVQTSISKLAARKINIIGAVKTPGTYLVNPFTTISNSLAYSGGVEDYAELRNIKLISGENVYFFDLYDLLIKGDRSGDLNLQQGDTIVVGGTSNLVKIYGQVHRPRIYHFDSSDTYKELIEFSLGFTSLSDKSKLYASVKNGSEIFSKKINLNDNVGQDELIEIYVNRDLIISKKNIQIRGKGVKETVIENNKYNSFKQLKESLMFGDDLYPYFAILQQQSNKGQVKETHYFSLNDPKTEEIELKENVEITFFDREDILNFNNPEFQTFNDFPVPNSFLKSLSVGNRQFEFLAVGKITPRLIFDYFDFNEKANTKGAFLVTNEGLIENAFDKEVDSKNLTSIYIPELDLKNITVSINGLVKNPGTYILSSNSTLKDLYTIAGEFENNANEEGILFSRESLKEVERNAVNTAKKDLIDASINGTNSSTNSFDFNSIFEILDQVESSEFLGRLTGDLSLSSSFSENLTLEDGDNIFVPPFRNTITIQGQVLSPTTTIFDPQFSVNDYIISAGGFSDSADENKIYIVKVDGTAEEFNSGFFRKNYVLQPGDTIVVPLNFDKIDPLSLVSVTAQILSNIAFSAASLNAISD